MVLCALVFGSGGYYIGTKKSTSPESTTNARSGGMWNGNREVGQSITGGMRGARTGGGFSGGEIINIDAQSLTVRPQGGGSTIVFYSSTTPITLMAAGSVADLSAGKSIIVTGKANPDGSITAASLQLRPEELSRQIINTPITR